MISIISIVGKSNSGKTTVIEKLLSISKKKNYHIATIKHDVHGFEMDKEGKDTFKHKKAGAVGTLILSENKLGLVKDLKFPLSLDEVITNFYADADLVITEGFKKQDKPKIEVIRKEISTKLLCKERELIAVVSDFKLNLKVPVFNFSEINKLFSLIETRYLKVKNYNRVQLNVDNKNIILKPFMQDLISETIKGMLCTLHNVQEQKNILIKIKND